jgi:hypothetical protein
MGFLAVTHTVLLIAAVVVAIPAVMIFLSLVLKPSANRWLNVIFGVLYQLQTQRSKSRPGAAAACLER